MELIKELIILREENLEEGAFKNAVVGAMMGVAAASPIAYKDYKHLQARQEREQIRHEFNVSAGTKSITHPIKAEYKKTAEQIADEYKIDLYDAAKVVELAHKHAKADFPTVKDILAVVDLESNFNPNAVSKLKDDPAIGLMQVRPESNGLDISDLNSMEEQIKHGVDILHKNYKQLKGNKLKALQAYNIGLKNYKKGKRAPEYLAKYKNAIKKYTEV